MTASITTNWDKTKELEVLIKRFKPSKKAEQSDYSLKTQDLQKQLTMAKEEAEKLQVFFILPDNLAAVEKSYQSLFGVWIRDKVQSYKFVPLVYQIVSRLRSSRDESGSNSFQSALVSLIIKMAIDHPYHTIFQLLALANGDRIKDNQRSRNLFVVDMDKKLAAEHLLQDVSHYHGPMLRQMKQLVDIYINFAEFETRREVPVVTATVPVDRSCQYNEGSFPFFGGLSDSVMNGINAPRVVECFGSDGQNISNLRNLAMMTSDKMLLWNNFLGLVNTFLHNNQETWKRRLVVRTYKLRLYISLQEVFCFFREI